MLKGLRNKRSYLKNARRFKPSSQLWLQRQLSDVYVHRAKSAGYRSRAAFKLVEIQEKHKIISPTNVVVDLGAAPGGWTQVLQEIINPNKGQIFALDILEMDPMENVHIIKGDFTTEVVFESLMQVLRSRLSNKCGVDVVLSDMAAPTIGHKQTDHLKIMYLAELALDFALKTLNEGGHFAAKLFMGGGDQDFVKQLKQNFTHVHHMKPESSRKESSELYVVACGRKKI